MAGTPPRAMRPPRGEHILKHMAFFGMLACAIWIFFLELTSKSDNPSFRNIGGASLSLIKNISLGVWVLFALMYTGITLHYARTHPFWPLVTMLLVLLMTAFFTTYLGFDPMDWSTWGPLAAVIGIIVKAGIHNTYNSADRGLLRQLRDCLMGNGEEVQANRTDNNSNNNAENRLSSANSAHNGQELEDMSHRRTDNV